MFEATRAMRWDVRRDDREASQVWVGLFSVAPEVPKATSWKQRSCRTNWRTNGHTRSVIRKVKGLRRRTAPPAARWNTRSHTLVRVPWHSATWRLLIRLNVDKVISKDELADFVPRLQN